MSFSFGSEVCMVCVGQSNRGGFAAFYGKLVRFPADKDIDLIRSIHFISGEVVQLVV